MLYYKSWKSVDSRRLAIYRRHKSYRGCFSNDYYKALGLWLRAFCFICKTLLLDFQRWLFLQEVKRIMPSEKVLDFPVDCNTLTGSVNLWYEYINHLALIVKAHGLPIIEIVLLLTLFQAVSLWRLLFYIP